MDTIAWASIQDVQPELVKGWGPFFSQRVPGKMSKHLWASLRRVKAFLGPFHPRSCQWILVTIKAHLEVRTWGSEWGRSQIILLSLALLDLDIILGKWGQSPNWRGEDTGWMCGAEASMVPGPSAGEPQQQWAWVLGTRGEDKLRKEEAGWQEEGKIKLDFTFLPRVLFSQHNTHFCLGFQSHDTEFHKLSSRNINITLYCHIIMLNSYNIRVGQYCYELIF